MANAYKVTDEIRRNCHHHYERVVMELCSECGATTGDSTYLPSLTGQTNKTVFIQVTAWRT